VKINNHGELAVRKLCFSVSQSENLSSFCLSPLLRFILMLVSMCWWQLSARNFHPTLESYKNLAFVAQRNVKTLSKFIKIHFGSN